MGGLIWVLAFSSVFLALGVGFSAIFENWHKVRHVPDLVGALGWRLTISVLACEDCRDEGWSYRLCYRHRLAWRARGSR